MKYADSRLAVLSNVSNSLLTSSWSTGWFSLSSISGCCSTWKRVALRKSITPSVTILQTRNVPTRYFKHECANRILQTRMCQHVTSNTSVPTRRMTNLQRDYSNNDGLQKRLSKHSLHIKRVTNAQNWTALSILKGTYFWQ